jgi:hypothetical protein
MAMAMAIDGFIFAAGVSRLVANRNIGYIKGHRGVNVTRESEMELSKGTFLAINFILEWTALESQFLNLL